MLFLNCPCGYPAPAPLDRLTADGKEYLQIRDFSKLMKKKWQDSSAVTGRGCCGSFRYLCKIPAALLTLPSGQHSRLVFLRPADWMTKLKCSQICILGTMNTCPTPLCCSQCCDGHHKHKDRQLDIVGPMKEGTISYSLTERLHPLTLSSKCRI